MKKEIERLLKSCKFTLSIASEYYGGDNTYFRTDKRTHDYAKAHAYNELKKIKRVNLVKFRNSCNNTWSGRLNFVVNSYHLEYTAGQFYNLELPQAIDAVLSDYNKSI